MVKIAITGPESTGKTVLAQDLADHFNAIWIPEYSRVYLEHRNGKYGYDDLEIIAREQEKKWQEVKNEKLVIYDTEFTVLKIWSEIKYGKVANYIIESLESQEFDHYFICNPVGVKWMEDPLREHPERREELFDLYIRVMESNRRSFTVLSGSWDDRLKKAISKTQSFLE